MRFPISTNLLLLALAINSATVQSFGYPRQTLHVAALQSMEENIAAEDEAYWSRFLDETNMSVTGTPPPTPPPVPLLVPPPTPVPIQSPRPPPFPPPAPSTLPSPTQPPQPVPTPPPVPPTTPPPVSGPTPPPTPPPVPNPTPSPPIPAPTPPPVPPATPPPVPSPTTSPTPSPVPNPTPSPPVRSPTPPPVPPITPPPVPGPTPPPSSPPTPAPVSRCDLILSVVCTVGEGIECSSYQSTPDTCEVANDYVYTFKNNGSDALFITEAVSQITGNEPLDLISLVVPKQLEAGTSTTVVTSQRVNYCQAFVNATTVAKANPGQCEAKASDAFTPS